MKKKPTIKYYWRPGFRSNRVDPQPVGEVLGQLIKRHKGKLKPALILNIARDLDSPLHDLFQWDDTAAAEEYRLWQARMVLSNITVKVIYKKQEKYLRSYVLVNEDEESAYVDTQRAMRNENLRDQVIETARRHLEGWRDRYQQYVFMARAVQVVDAVIQEELTLQTAQKRKSAAPTVSPN